MATHDVRQIRLVLQRREYLRMLGALLKMLVGLPLCLVAPVLLGTAFWFAADALGLMVSWWAWTGGLALLTLPLLVIRACETTSGPLNELVAEGEKPTPAALGRFSGAHVGLLGAGWMPVLANPRLFGAGATELFLVGPRAVVGGVRTWRLGQRIGHVDRARAAELLDAMLQHTEGVAVAKFERPGDPEERLLAVINYLVVYGWIGIRANSDFVYLFSEARRRLQSE